MALTFNRNSAGNDRRPGKAVLAAGAATLILVGLSGSADAYEPRRYSDPALSAVRPSQSTATTAKRKRSLRSQSRRWQNAEPNKAQLPQKISGPLTIVVSIKSQRVTLYANGEAVDRAAVSTGTASHPTPVGVFSILQKNRHHRSNIYSGAPMPYMQRVTWSGVALHQGVLPGYPASHGCIRLPQDFASRLWEVTELGARVIITQEDVTPASITHARLFAAKPKQAVAPVALREPEAAPPAKIRLATNAEMSAASTLPVAAAEPAKEADPIDEGRTLTEMIRAEQAKDGEAERAAQITDKSSDFEKGRLIASAKEIPLRPGPISVFISGSLGKLYVRKGLWPVFEAPVTIAQPDAPFGTHVFTALEQKGTDGALRWSVVSMPNDARKLKGQQWLSRAERKLMAAAAPQIIPPADPADVLNRITIPEDAQARISELMTPGASLIISDLGMSHETTPRGTDFIILTR